MRFSLCRRYAACTHPELLPLPRTLKQKRELISKDACEKTTLYGWVKTVRKHKKVAFANIHDGSDEHVQQLVFADPEAVNDLKVGTAVEATGVPKKRQQQPYELLVDNLTILGGVADQFPLQSKYLSQEYLRRELPSVRFRSQLNGVTLRFRSKAAAALSDFFNKHEFIQTHPPLITSSDCEGAGEVFSVNSESPDLFFGKRGYLTVSTQLHLEALMMGLSRVWTLSPAFRAEKSVTSRHLSEFWMLEAEVAFVDKLEHVMSLVEDMLRSAVATLKNDGQLDSVLAMKAFLEKQKIEGGEGEEPDREITAGQVAERWAMILQPQKWMRISYAQAISVLQEAHSHAVTFETVPEFGQSLGSEHEKWLAKEYAKGPVFVTHYPVQLKPFYMLRLDQTAECFDLLLPDIGELVGGSLREHDLERIQAAVQKFGVNPEDLQWYIDLRKYGSVPHGGFGMGFERLICYLVGVYNVKDAIPFPRWVNHCAC